LHAGHVLHLLALLIAGIWAALVPLLLLFGSLRQDLDSLFVLLIGFRSRSSSFIRPKIQDAVLGLR